MNYWIFKVTPAQGDAMLEYIEKVSPNGQAYPSGTRRSTGVAYKNMIGKP
jgi:hypothetical protein